MTDWEEIQARDFLVPGDRPLPDLVEELCSMLGSPDPQVRDDTAFTVLATWTARGVLDGRLALLGDQLAGRMHGGEIYERTFAALTLSWVVLRDAQTSELADGQVLGWLAAFGSWWRQEKDLRGWDAQLGWLHAAGHGADAVLAFGRSPRLPAGALQALLELTVDRLFTDQGYVFADGEDYRIAYALASVLTRPELSAAQATAWLDRVRDAIGKGEPGPVPPWAANTLSTLASLYSFADRGVAWYDPLARSMGATVPVPHATELKDQIATVLRQPWRGLG